MTINSGYILRNIYGKNILMPVCRNEAGDTPILLNDIAAEIWNKAKESGDRKELCDAIAELYGLQEGTVEKSAVRVFIDELIKMRLIYD